MKYHILILYGHIGNLMHGCVKSKIFENMVAQVNKEVFTKIDISL